MGGYISRLLKNQIGFSMVQALVGLGVVGGLSLVVAQLGKQASQNQKAASSSYAVAELSAEVQNLLSNQRNCLETFQGVQLAPDKKVDIPLLRKGGQVSKFHTMLQKDNNEEVTVSKMTLVRPAEERADTSTLIITFRRNAAAAGTALTSSTISREFLINTVWDDSNRIVSCASDVSNFIDTVTELAILRACPPRGAGEESRRFLPNDEDAPTACQAMAQLIDDSNDLVCPAGSNYVGFEWRDGRYHKICRQAINAESCASDQLLHRDSEGNLKCVKVSCGVGEVARGFNPSTGEIDCLQCAPGEIPVKNTAQWVCAGLRCGSGEVLKGITSMGTPNCAPLIETNSCPDVGGRLVLGSNGELKLECCQPTCNDNANHCSGISYPSSTGCGYCTGTATPNCSPALAANHCVGTSYQAPNNCGTCIGTKPPDCSDAGNYCLGSSYQSTNGCGSCTGTRAAVAETSTWVETTTYRAKPGALCSGGVVTRQRLRNKICNDDAICGGAACTPETQWVDDGTQSCAPPCMNGAIRSGTQISHTRNFNYCGGSLYSGDIYVSKCEQCIGGVWVEQTGQKHFYRSQNVCSNGKPIPPSSTVTLCRATDPCVSGTKVTGYNEVSNSNGIFDFCSFNFKGGGGCFIAGTKITLLNGEKKNIEEIQVGDELMDGSKQKVTVKKLIRLFHNGDIVSINGGGYFFTPNHPFLTTTGWRSLDPEMSNKESPGLDVKLLRIGDILIKRNGVEVVRTLDRIQTSEQVYNFELDGSHEYIADEYVVHNKITPCMTGGSGGGGGMLDSGSSGGMTTGSYQEPCINEYP